MFATLTKLFRPTISKNQPKRQNYRPRLEGLEDRMLMAGNIHAALSTGGSLVLTEAPGHVGRDSGVTINQLAPGVIRVEGSAAPDGTKSLIDGVPFRDFPNVTGGLSVNLGAGRDNVFIGTNAPIFFTSVNIDVGTNDSSLHGDNVNISSLNANSLRIDTGAGNDTVFISASAVSSDSAVSSHLQVGMGRGNDTLTILSTEADVITFVMDPNVTTGHTDDFGIDTVRIDTLIAKTGVFVQTDPQYLPNITPVNKGNRDFVSMSHVTAGGYVAINTFAGNDTVKLTDVRAVDSLFTDLGAGDDLLEMLNCSANEIKVSGGTGSDIFRRKDVSFGTQMRIVGFEKIENLLLLNPTATNSNLTLTSK